MSDRLMNALIVEDEPAVQKVIVMILEWLGFESSVASSVEEGLRFLDEDDFRLVLTDLKLPGGDGFEIATAAGRRVPRPAILLVSGFVTETDEARAKEAGLTVLHKPFNARDAKVAIEAILAEPRAL